MASQKKEIKNKERNHDQYERRKHLKDETLQSIFAILSFIVGIFLLIAAFQKAGVAGNKIYSAFHFLFGVGYYLLPILSFIMGIVFIRTIERTFSYTKLIAAFFFFVSGLGIIELSSSGSGGFFGKFISGPLVSMFDVYFSFIALSALVVVSLLVLFETHLRQDWKKPFLLFGGSKEEDEKSETLSEREEEVLNKATPQKEIQNEKIGGPLVHDIIDTKKRKEKEEEDFIGTAQPVLLNKEYTPPPLSLLEGDKGKPGVGDIKANANIIKRTLQNFGIVVEMDEVTIGPTVTRYALKPAEGVKLSKIVGLQDNLALALAAPTIRIEAPIPGKSLVGIEVPNTSKTTVGLGSLIASKEFETSDKPLLTAIGKDVGGKAIFYNLAKMPHLLIAGTTGSGKSVTVHAILTSLLYRNSPDMLKFIMVDAKRVELTLYNKIAHLLTPVITDAKKTILALKWAAKEMDRRYDVLEKESVRDIHSYHKNIVEPALKKNKGVKDAVMPEIMPYIVIVIDELADLMQAYPRELEASIVRLAQMSRAVGIHLILSTQRPSVNVITGLIKANIPTRIALKVGSQVDSRTIIDKAGAEKLVGLGDMLFATQDNPEPVRIQSPYISEGELKSVVKYLIDSYINEIPSLDISTQTGENTEPNPIFGSGSFSDGSDEDEDDLYEDARQIVIEAGKASTSYIQRKLRVGYARAARLMDILEEKGVIGPADGSKPREVLVERGESDVHID